MTIKLAILLLPLLLLAALPACAGAKQAAESKQAKTEKDIAAVLHMQADAWNRGDLEAFMNGYVRSPETSYLSGGKEIRGYDAVYERYRTRYGASPNTMGKLTFSDLRVNSLGDNSALGIGKWLLKRENEPELSGMFSLVFLRTKAGWKILHDHTSTN